MTAARSMAVAVVLLVMTAAPAGAHAVTIGQSRLTQDGAVVHHELAVSYHEVAKRVDLGLAGATDDRPAHTDAALGAALRDAGAEVGAFVVAHVEVRADGRACAARLTGVEALRHGGELFAVLDVEHRCPTVSPSTYTVEHTLLADDLAEAERASHASVVDYDLAGETGKTMFQPGAHQLVVGEGAGAASGLGGVSLGTAAPVAVGFAALLAGVALRRGRRPSRSPR